MRSKDDAPTRRWANHCGWCDLNGDDGDWRKRAQIYYSCYDCYCIFVCLKCAKRRAEEETGENDTKLEIFLHCTQFGMLDGAGLLLLTQTASFWCSFSESSLWIWMQQREENVAQKKITKQKSRNELTIFVMRVRHRQCRRCCATEERCAHPTSRDSMKRVRINNAGRRRWRWSRFKRCLFDDFSFKKFFFPFFFSLFSHFRSPAAMVSQTKRLCFVREWVVCHSCTFYIYALNKNDTKNVNMEYLCARAVPRNGYVWRGREKERGEEIKWNKIHCVSVGWILEFAIVISGAATTAAMQKFSYLIGKYILVASSAASWDILAHFVSFRSLVGWLVELYAWYKLRAVIYIWNIFVCAHSVTTKSPVHFTAAASLPSLLMKRNRMNSRISDMWTEKICSVGLTVWCLCDFSLPHISLSTLN